MSDIEILKERVRERVENGGHGIDDGVIERRYGSSLENLKKAIPLCDNIMIFENSNGELALVLEVRGKEIIFNRLPKYIDINLSHLQS